MPSEVLRQLDASYGIVLQSKRLRLQSALRRLRGRPGDAELAARASRLQRDITRTIAMRARICLQHGDIGDPQFWIDAYGLLIQQGEDLAGQLRDGHNDAVVDLPLINVHLGLWRRRLRDWMLAASA